MYVYNRSFDKVGIVDASGQIYNRSYGKVGHVDGAGSAAYIGGAGVLLLGLAPDWKTPYADRG
ncbi:hypothetical protein ABZ845_31785 [Streptomyces sp. NPDC047022]|uniref:hypothetical protein n=1 Tax=Streptomyces sp. NPDC047022 TaxID=3155737 RepID=UPI0033F096E3